MLTRKAIGDCGRAAGSRKVEGEGSLVGKRRAQGPIAAFQGSPRDPFAFAAVYLTQEEITVELLDAKTMPVGFGARPR